MYQWHLTPGGVNLKTIFNFLESAHLQNEFNC